MARSRRLLGNGRILVETNFATGLPGTVVGRLPSGVAAGPVAAPDLIALEAVYLRGEEGKQTKCGLPT
jgi:hypothetical protein